jgi:hypothetical protein
MDNEQIENNDSLADIYIPTWDDIRTQRNDMLLHAETQYNFDSPQEFIDAWLEYKQALRDIPETYKDLEDLNQIGWPMQPNFDQQLQLSRYLR